MKMLRLLSKVDFLCRAQSLVMLTCLYCGEPLIKV